jgi:hypothetical protein
MMRPVIMQPGLSASAPDRLATNAAARITPGNCARIISP